MNNDRLPTKEQIQKAEKLLSEREKWLKEVFIPQLQKKFPEFQKVLYTIKCSCNH